MNSIWGLFRRFFSDVSRRLGEHRGPRHGSGSTSSTRYPSQVGPNGSEEGESIDLLRDTLTSAPAPKLR